MRKTLQFERGPATYGQRISEKKGLKGYDDLLPGQLAALAAVDLPSRLLKPAAA
jgi:hypothetical protein